MNELIRIENRDGELFADSRQVASVLGIEHRAILQLIRQNELDFKRVAFEMTPLETAGGVQNTTFANIPETECLLLITYVKNTDEAKVAKRALIEAFQSMRKALMAPKQPTGMALMSMALIEAHTYLEQQQKQIADLTPKAEFYDAVTGSDDTLSMNDVAKILNFEGMGRNNLFEYLRSKKILDRQNTPYQRFCDALWFRVTETSYTDAKNYTHITKVTLVLQKGIDAIRKQLIKDGYIPKKIVGFIDLSED